MLSNGVDHERCRLVVLKAGCVIYHGKISMSQRKIVKSEIALAKKINTASVLKKCPYLNEH